jgi:hypothetical protein
MIALAIYPRTYLRLKEFHGRLSEFVRVFGGQNRPILLNRAILAGVKTCV